MPRTHLDHTNVQGGKEWGKLKKQQEQDIDDAIENIIRENTYPDVEDLAEKMQSIKEKFILYDIDGSGDLDEKDIGAMLEKLEQPKNTLEIRKMIKEVDLNNSGTINFSEFVKLMLGGKNSILRIIMMFEEKKKEQEKPKGPPPKKSFADLP
ncbi:allograft inflammatory factor 1-like [Diadema antillarum]|uniref:allograft inflammatory factor 1-like n=2 Tax=Diadema antillarum TaxID=105358 RepID=UPI003A850862